MKMITSLWSTGKHFRNQYKERIRLVNFNELYCLMIVCMSPLYSHPSPSFCLRGVALLTYGQPDIIESFKQVCGWRQHVIICCLHPDDRIWYRCAVLQYKYESTVILVSEQ